MQSTAAQIQAFIENYQSQSLDDIRKKAADNDPEAQFQLGLLYSYGNSVDYDLQQAVLWLNRAAESGQVAAMTLLAWIHLKGEGVEPNHAVAFSWYQKAAEANDIDAQCALADLYLEGGQGIEQNLKAMMQWYERAANAGHAKAQYMLGSLLSEGKLVQQNDEAAFQWLTLAVMNQSEPAQKALAMLTARLDKATIESYKSRMISMVEAPH